MTPEQRQEIIRRLEAGEELSAEWARFLFPPEKREYELVYHGKEREEDILANTLAVPLQAVRTFGKNGGGEWHNMLIFGDNLQVMKSLLELKKAGKLCNADGTPGVRVLYIDPPFATKREFGGTADQKAYQDKIAGAEFLEFLRKRLVLIRELLADDGHVCACGLPQGNTSRCCSTRFSSTTSQRNHPSGKSVQNLQQQFRQISRLNVRHDNLFGHAQPAGARFRLFGWRSIIRGNPEGHWHHFWSADRHTMRYKFFVTNLKPGSGCGKRTGQRKLSQTTRDFTRGWRSHFGRVLARYRACTRIHSQKSRRRQTPVLASAC